MVDRWSGAGKRAYLALWAAATLWACSSGSAKERAVLASRVMGEDRLLLIDLPASYPDSARSFPVLYLLDAWDSSTLETWRPALRQVASSGVGEMIVVGIVNTDRRRDMLPAGSSGSAGESRADAFLQFLSHELIPWVDARYRTDGRRIVFGRSDSGLLVVYAFVTRPEIFTSYIASSPTLGRCPELIQERAGAVLAQGRADDRRLFVIYGERDGSLSREPLPAFAALLSDRPPGQERWTVVMAPGQRHLPEGALAAGLQFVFQH